MEESKQMTILTLILINYSLILGHFLVFLGFLKYYYFLMSSTPCEILSACAEALQDMHP